MLAGGGLWMWEPWVAVGRQWRPAAMERVVQWWVHGDGEMGTEEDVAAIADAAKLAEEGG